MTRTVCWWLEALVKAGDLSMLQVCYLESFRVFCLTSRQCVLTKQTALLHRPAVRVEVTVAKLLQGAEAGLGDRGKFKGIKGMVYIVSVL